MDQTDNDTKPQAALMSAPAESAPAESAPAESAPAESAPAESAPAESAPDHAVSTTNKKSAATALMIVLLLVLAGVTAAGGYWLWLQMNQQLGQQQEQLTTLAQATEAQRQQRQQLATELAQSLARFEQAQAANQSLFADFVGKVEAQLNAQSNQLAQMTAASRTQFLLSEAQFLVRQASQRLQLERSPASAVGLFRLADQLLAKVETDLGSPTALVATRQQLALDLGKLQNLQAVDYTGVFFALDSILNQVDALAVSQPPREFANEEVEPAVIRRNPDTLWAKITVGWRNFTRELASYVRVRRLEEPVEPLLSPDQETRVRENLKLKLQVAQLALLRADGKLFGNNLDLARQWLLEYFPVSNARNQMIEQLSSLAARSVNSELPDISASARSLDRYIDQYRRDAGVRL